jgi:hypothetical protein
MLEQLLHLIAQGGVHSYQDVIQSLSITQPLLEAMLEDLARMGYLRSVGSGCEGNCPACPMGGCSVSGPGRLWVLTDKGAAASARLSGT